MGAASVNVTIRNPADPRGSRTGPVPVDTGAFDSFDPKAHLEAIGREPRGIREHSPANGERVTREVTVAEIEFHGEIVGGTIAHGDEDSEALLGVTALESGRFEVVPRRRVLKRGRAVRLNGMRMTVGADAGWNGLEATLTDE